MHALLNSMEHFTFRSKFQVSSDVRLIARALGRPADLKTSHGAVQNALSRVIDRIAPNARRSQKKSRWSTRADTLQNEVRRAATQLTTRLIVVAELSEVT